MDSFNHENINQSKNTDYLEGFSALNHHTSPIRDSSHIGQSQIVSSAYDHDQHVRPIHHFRQKIFEGDETALKDRINKIKKLKKHIIKYRKKCFEAISTDFQKSEYEFYSGEFLPTIRQINHQIKLSKKHLKPYSVSSGLFAPVKSKIQRVPKGVVFIASPWNFPLYLSIAPFVSAYLTGNRVVLHTTHRLQVFYDYLKIIFDELFSEDELYFPRPDVTTYQELIQHEYDHIFFTGSTLKGKELYNSINNHTIPSLTLELGGKSPSIVSKHADLDSAAEKIIYGKFFNSGQTCVAVDYVLCDESIKDQFSKKLVAHLKLMYGQDETIRLHNDDLSHIIDQNEFLRLEKSLNQAYKDGAELLIGGTTDRASLKMTPTILENVPAYTPLMANEIFGPILPILTYKKLDHAIDFINSRPTPLTAYLFTEDKREKKQCISRVKSSSVTVNHSIFQMGNLNAPFGGQGLSGIGQYNGLFSIETFTHSKVITTYCSKILSFLLLPPYKIKKKHFINLIFKYFSKFL